MTANYSENNDLLIQQNSQIIEFYYPKIIGKLLFWSWLQVIELSIITEFGPILDGSDLNILLNELYL